MFPVCTLERLTLQNLVPSTSVSCLNCQALGKLEDLPFKISWRGTSFPSPWHWGKELTLMGQFSSVQFIRSVMSDSLWPHGLQHARPPYPSPAPGIHSDSCSSSQWCHPAISFSVVPFSSCPHSLPASKSFPMSQLFAWGGQSTGRNPRVDLLQNGLVGSPCSPRDPQKSSLVPQFESIHSSVFSLLYGLYYWSCKEGNISWIHSTGLREGKQTLWVLKFSQLTALMKFSHCRKGELNQNWYCQVEESEIWIWKGCHG